jgi:hypothetical protein
MLTIALSPYHLTSREPPALAALLLADRVVTLLPAPHTGTSRADVAGAVERSPRYLRFMESWRWSMPLWRAGVIASSFDGCELSAELHELYRLVDTDDSLAPLRSLLRRGSGADPDEFLDHLAADILKGGPDPAISIPVAAALDRFAARHALPVARSAGNSIAQKAESRLGRRLYAGALPVLLQASALRLLQIREKLQRRLAPLRDAIGAPHGAPAKGAPAPGAFAAAAKEFTSAFEALPESLIGGDDEEGRRIVRGYVSITAMLLPSDVVLRSSLVAARALGARIPAARTSGPAGAPLGDQGGEPLIVLVVKPMSVRPTPQHADKPES